MIVAIDPGNAHSAMVVVDGALTVLHATYVDNFAVRRYLDWYAVHGVNGAPATFVIEMVQSFGMAVGASVFETVFWIGRFCERWESRTKREAHRLYRTAIKNHLCNSTRAKDGNVRQALIDRYARDHGIADPIGRKKTPGPLYGIAGDVWSALAVAVTFHDKNKHKERT